MTHYVFSDSALFTIGAYLPTLTWTPDLTCIGISLAVTGFIGGLALVVTGEAPAWLVVLYEFLDMTS
jgi:hypothetical protein